MRVAIDRNSLQARAHRRDGQRLTALLAELRRIPAEADLTEHPRLTTSALEDVDVLVIPTRSPSSASPSAQEIADATPTAIELDAISRFVGCGRGLLLLSNHGDIPAIGAPDHTERDAMIAALFGVSIERAVFWSGVHGQLTEIALNDLCAHEVIESRGGAPVRSIVTNNCCSVSAEQGSAVARIPLSAQPGDKNSTRLFAVALDGPADGCGAGRVIVGADSGFVGSPGTSRPGPGLLDRGDNLQFILNAVRWLARDSRCSER